MSNDRLENLFRTLPLATAYHKLVYDSKGNPDDYQFVDINPAFETMTGLKREQILGKSVKEVLPTIVQGDFDWVGIYANVAKTGESVRFKQYSKEFDKWYDITAFSDQKNYFWVVFREITEDISEKTALQHIVEMSEGCLHHFGEPFILDRIIEVARSISGAKFAGFNIYDESGISFKTISLAGVSKNLPKIIDLLGFNPLNRTWEHDALREQKIANNIITEFDSLAQLTGKVISEKPISTASSVFRIGKTYVSKIMNDNKMLGDFTLMMPTGSQIQNIESIKVLSGLAGQYLERLRTYEKLRSSTMELEEFFNVNLDLLCIADTDGNFLRVNKAWSDVLGYNEEELKAGNFLDLIHPDDLESTLDALSKLDRQEKVLNFVNRYQAKDGSYKHIEWRSNPSGKLIYAAARDITDRIHLEEKSFIEQEKFKMTLLSVGDGIIATDSDGRITVINKVAEYLTGWTQDQAIGRPLDEVFHIVHEHTRVPCANPAREVLLTGKTIELENHTALINKEGQMIPVEDSAAPIIGPSGRVTGVVIVFRDYTEKREKHREVEYLSFHDHLTGLYNRRYLEDSLKRLDTIRNLPLAIFVIDVNGLKLTNDAYGHDMGDELLKSVAGILKKACRSDDIIVRTGGDEFVILHSKTDDDQAEAIRRRIQNLANREKLNAIIVSLAIGFSIKTEPDQSVWEIMKQADNHMYKNKLKHGKFMRSQTIETVLRNINNKYDNEQIHTERVSGYCAAIGRAMGFTEARVGELRTVGVLHDIGKITVSPDILNKSDKLTQSEWDEIKRHPVTGYNILKGVEEYAVFAEAVLHHHERWDGNGYPSGLKGKSIPLYARMIAVADAFEAMTAQRAYQKGKLLEEAVNELKKYSGTQFDAEIVHLFIEKVLK